MNLKDILVAQIQRTGPVSVADYMTTCLSHPKFGYYCVHDPLGAKGDFTTAPEISQMFGEILGLALAQSWRDQGRPSPFTLAELGPGHGTLMADILRATGALPDFRRAANLVLLEMSPILRAEQAKRLQAYDPTWIDSATDLPSAPLFLVANEFFDALPIRQFVRDGLGWRECLVGLTGQDLEFGLGPMVNQPALSHRLDDTNDGDLVELRDPAERTMGLLAGCIARHGGTALVVDYGDWRSLGNTLQAVRSHRSVNPLTEPGRTDLTAHVAFEPLANAARTAGAQVMKLEKQGVFLERLGITARAQALARNLRDRELDQHIAAHRRLTHPDEMGTLFKVLGIIPHGSPLPPGLHPWHWKS